ncbi:MAG: hypothetical protein M0Z41_17245 [Peptococcaceae bacterium]|jgi:hypothetical protein|nr:hypothetical protein [Peptococcaceae bacterium]
MLTTLREIAHSRAGDKGNTLNLSLIPYNEDDYPLLVDLITAGRVRDFFSGIVEGEVSRYEVPGIKALNFVMPNALAGGVTRSVQIDPHGKCLSALLLDMEIER